MVKVLEFTIFNAFVCSWKLFWLIFEKLKLTVEVCAECGEGFHAACHVPPISEEPTTGAWTCRFCVLSFCSSQGGMRKSAVYETVLRQIRSSLPYDIGKLNWDAGGKTNSDEKYCYCGGPGKAKILTRNYFSLISQICSLDHFLVSGDF